MHVEPSLHQWLMVHFDEFDGLIFDIDGVLLKGDRPAPGSRHLLAMLNRRNIPFLLLTNDSNHSVEEKALHLRQAGIPIGSESIVSCAHALVPLADERHLRGLRFFIMGDLGNPCYAQAAGLETTRDLANLPGCKGVIIGENHYDWEPAINAAVNFFIQTPDALLIVPNPDEFYPGLSFEIQLAAGSVGRMIQRALAAYGLGFAPIYLGKPHAPVFDIAHRRMQQTAGRKLAGQRILMTGDNLAADVGGATGFGYRSALVLTGVTDRRMLEYARLKPQLAFERL
jgi:HAD superfamily hydrolase (TIGR01450 family)